MEDEGTVVIHSYQVNRFVSRVVRMKSRCFTLEFTSLLSFDILARASTRIIKSKKVHEPNSSTVRSLGTVLRDVFLFSSSL